MLYFDLLSSDIVKEGTDSKHDMSFSKLNSHLDSNTDNTIEKVVNSHSSVHCNLVHLKKVQNNLGLVIKAVFNYYNLQLV